MTRFLRCNAEPCGPLFVLTSSLFPREDFWMIHTKPNLVDARSLSQLGETPVTATLPTAVAEASATIAVRPVCIKYAFPCSVRRSNAVNRSAGASFDP